MAPAEGTVDRRTQLFGLALVTAVAAALRFYRLGAQSLWLDEAISYSFSVLLNDSPSSLLSFISSNDIHPPLYYLLLRFWTIIGESEASLRSLSAIASIASVPLLYLILHRLLGFRVALAGAALLAISPFHIWYAQEVRMYALLGLLILTTIYSAIEYWRKRSIAWLIVYALSAAMMLYTHYSSFLFLLMINVAFFVASRGIDRTRNWLIAQLAVGLLYLPWLPTLLEQTARGGRKWFAFVPSFADVGRVLFSFLFGSSFGTVSSSVVLYGLAIAVVALMLVYVASRKAESKSGMLYLALWLLIPIAGAVLISYRTTVFGDKYLIGSSFALLGIIAATLTIPSRSLRIPLLVTLSAVIVPTTLISLNNYYNNPDVQREDWRSAVRFVESSSRPGDVVAFRWIRPMAPFEYYSEDLLPAVGLVKDAEAAPVSEEGVFESVYELSGSHDRVWLFEYLGDHYDPDRFVHSALRESGYEAIDEFAFKDVTVGLWAADP